MRGSIERFTPIIGARKDRMMQMQLSKTSNPLVGAHLLLGPTIRRLKLADRTLNRQYEPTGLSLRSQRFANRLGKRPLLPG
jgi:hypothetical protein